MDAMNIAVVPSLTDLAQRINAEHREACAALARSLHHAMAAGDMLVEAKRRVKREGGQWLPWLSQHCAMSERSAQVYMKLAKNRQAIEARSAAGAADFSIRNAIELLKPPKAEPEGFELPKIGDVKSEEAGREAPLMDMAPAPAASSAAADQLEERVELDAEKVAALGAKASSEIASAQADIMYARAQRANFQGVSEYAQAKIATFFEIERAAIEEVERLNQIVKLVEVIRAGPDGAGQGNAADPQTDGAGL
jgi:hypothetical protein